eukprot:2409567-Rhodomonas_salina.1
MSAPEFASVKSKAINQRLPTVCTRSAAAIVLVSQAGSWRSPRAPGLPLPSARRRDAESR